MIKIVKQLIPRYDINRRLQKHTREFNRYNREIKQASIGKQTHQKIKQQEYSSQMASKELAIMDELSKNLKLSDNNDLKKVCLNFECEIRLSKHCENLKCINREQIKPNL